MIGLAPRAARKVAPSPAPARRPTVGVIVPSYNYGHLLEGCVRSVLAQDDAVEPRVLVVDDLSSDDTAEVGARLAAADPRVTFVRHAINQGLIGTANEGLAWASGTTDYVVLLSADDFLTPGALGRAVAVMEAHPEVGMAYGHAPYFGDADDPLSEPTGDWAGTDLWRGADWIARRCRSGHNCISSPEVVVRTAVQDAVGGYDPDCTHASDLNMWLRIAAVADVAYLRGVAQARYRVHADSMLRSGHNPLRDLRERAKAFSSFFARSGDRLGGRRAALEASAGRALARQALWRASRAIDRDLLDGPDALPFDDLVAFAREVCPDVERLREWHGLRLRQRLGAGRSRWFVPFLVTGAAHRVRSSAANYLGARTGV